MFGLKSGAFKEWLCISFIVCLLVFLALGSVLWRRSPVKPDKVSAAEIIQKQLEAILEKGTVYHHKVFYYSGLAPDKPEPQPTIYEIWDDQDSDRFKNVVIYPGEWKVIQTFDGDVRWDYDEEEKTLRKDIYIYPDSSEKEVQHGDKPDLAKTDLAKTYRELLENGVLKTYEGELEGKKVWIVVAERERTRSITFWNRFYFEKETFTLLRQESWRKENGKEVLTDRMDYEIIESIPKKGLDVNEFFRFDYLLPEDTVVLERHFNFASGYVEDDYYPATPSAIPTAHPGPIATITPISTPGPSENWETYTNTKYGFTLCYPKDFEVFEKIRIPEKSTVFTITLPYTDMVGLQVIVDSDVGSLGLRDWWFENFESFHGGEIGSPGDDDYYKFTPDDFTIKEEYFQERPALIVTAQSVYEELGMERRKGIVCTEDEDVFYLTLPLDNPTLNLILSTFKFLE